MNREEVQDIIFEKLEYEFPRLPIETIHELMEVIGDNWNWEEEYLKVMLGYIEKGIMIFSKEEFIRIRKDLWSKAEENMEYYMDLLQDRNCCICWKDEQYKRAEENCDLEETEPIYIYCE